MESGLIVCGDFTLEYPKSIVSTILYQYSSKVAQRPTAATGAFNIYLI